MIMAKNAFFIDCDIFFQMEVGGRIADEKKQSPFLSRDILNEHFRQSLMWVLCYLPPSSPF